MRFEFRRDGLCLLALGLMTLAAYWHVLGNDFAGYDDDQYITSNAHVKAGLAWEGVRWAFSTGAAANWHPLTWLSHMVDCAVYGLNPKGHHLTNLLFHAANTLLLYWFLRKTTGHCARSFFVAGLFALHPLHVESVAWISERKDVLSGCLFMLALLAYVRYAEQPSVRRYTLVAAALVLGLMAKPMLVTLPCVLLLLDYWPLARYRHRGWQRLVVEKLPLFGLSAASCVVTVIAQQRGGGMLSLDQISWAARIKNTPVAYAAYLGKMLYPADLSVLYPHPGDALPLTRALGALVLLIVVTAALFFLRRRLPHAWMGWLWYGGMLAPVIGIVQVGNQAYADRYTYLPLIGIFIGAIWTISEIGRRARIGRVALPAVGVVVLAACGLAAVHQIAYWRDMASLFQQAVRVTPDDKFARYFLGMAYQTKGRYPEAAAEFEIVLRIDPDHIKAMTRLGACMGGLGRADEAVQIYQRVLSRKPDCVDAQLNLGMILFGRGDVASALQLFSDALVLAPENPDAHFNMGVALYNLGRNPEALAHFVEALRLRPDDADVEYTRGMVLLRLNRPDEALTAFTRVLDIKPDHAGARAALAACGGSAPANALQ